MAIWRCPCIEKPTGRRKVPCDFYLAKASAFKVAQRNASQDLKKAYNQAFTVQLAMRIISKISMNKLKPSGCICISHCPAFWIDPLTTTRVRPVFNCRFKLRGKPSLNEFIFPGVHSMAKLLDLLHYFRATCYTPFNDIQKAFLIIFLKSRRPP